MTLMATKTRWAHVGADAVQRTVTTSVPIEIDPPQRNLFRIPVKQLGWQRHLEVAALEWNLAVATDKANIGVIRAFLVERQFLSAFVK